MQILVLFNAQDGLNLLYVASQFGHTEVVDTLLKNGANPNLTIVVQELHVVLVKDVCLCVVHVCMCMCVLVYYTTCNRACYILLTTYQRVSRLSMYGCS